MTENLNIRLPNLMREFVNRQSGDDGLYATPSEYISALIRQDMEAKNIVDHVLTGLDDVKNERFSKKSILDIASED